ncbi:MAG: ATP-dependent zinc metalloprotease FtsH [Sedimentisphaerales bacterium]|nr:ATP-dependent zinc metalloprotease FtsH [Sedimentisphaerales bacterium]
MYNKNENDNEKRKKSKRSDGPSGPGARIKGPRNMFGWLLIIIFGVMMFSMVTDMGLHTEKIPYSEFEKRVQNGEVKDVAISGDHLTGNMKDEAMTGKDPKEKKKFEVVLPGPGKPEGLTDLLRKNDVLFKFEQPSTFVQILVSLLPWVLLIGIMYFFIFRQFRGGGAGMLGSFGRSRHKVASEEQSKITFEDVAGIDEAKDEVEEIIQFLRNPRKFQRLGGRIPRGILLVGAPGCGKTLLAKAIAGEADVPFFSISGSDFVEMFVGVGASRVRDLFKQAKESSPCIIFLDEVDAVGRKRGANIAGGGHDEREQTLNAILVEMDGFSTDDQVIVIAATNRADILDHALTRPGRFDRQIYVPLPDIKGRMEILKVHAKKIKMGPDIDLQRLARGTSSFSGADLEAIINEAALSATMANKENVEMSDLEEARDKVRWGRARRSRVIDEEEKIATAYHEAGHALVQILSEHADPLHKVSIIPRGNMGGATFSLPEKDRTMYTKQYCLAEIRVTFGGRVAEEILCNDISSGAQADIQQATEIARRMIMEWGMSEKLGFVRYGHDGSGGWFGDMPGGREYSDRTADLIDAEIKKIMDEAYEDVKKIILDHREEMESLEQALMKYETLDGDEVKQIIEGKTLDKPTVGDLLAAEQKNSIEKE